MSKGASAAEATSAAEPMSCQVRVSKMATAKVAAGEMPSAKMATAKVSPAEMPALEVSAS